MCGIVGCITDQPIDNDFFYQSIHSLAHRGPDSYGTWTDENLGVYLGHRRLSVIDLTKDGNQPMVSHSGRYVITYNGEIYNYQKLREELNTQRNSVQWKGNSDTEVLLTSIEHWGFEKAIQKCNGMFAFGLLDRKKKTFYLVRDRIGEKPLYYGWINSTLIFASELKALKLHPDWNGKINPEALSVFIQKGYIPAPLSIYDGIYKLLPGNILRLSLAHGADKTVKFNSYWSLFDVIQQGLKHPFSGTKEEAVEQLDALITKSVTQQMVADVPLGVFLSGGYDSTLITAIMQAQSDSPIQTFSIGFHEKKYNEANFAKTVAEVLKTNHTELYVSSKDAMTVIPKLAQIYDEPFGDPSQIPTYLLSTLTRKHVTVALSGDGGDELFYGYDKYSRVINAWNMVKLVPYTIRKKISVLLSKISENALDKYLYRIDPLLQKYFQPGSFKKRLNVIARSLAKKDFNEFYAEYNTHWKEPDSLLLVKQKKHKPFYDELLLNQIGDHHLRMLYCDSTTFLPDDILVKVDRASMHVSLEARIPLLDRSIFEYVWSLPKHMRWRKGYRKWALRQVLYRYITPQIMERPKQGFSIPIGEWLRGELKEWAEELLNFQNGERDNLYFQEEPVKALWQAHQDRKEDHTNVLWNILMFQSWLQLQ